MGDECIYLPNISMIWLTFFSYMEPYMEPTFPSFFWGGGGYSNLAHVVVLILWQLHVENSCGSWKRFFLQGGLSRPP